jgi:hypothetical protein
MWLRRTKLTLLSVATVAALLLSTFGSMVSPGTAFAAGEKYTFQDANTIIGSGGDFPQSMTFKLKDGNYSAVYSVGAGKGGAVSRSWTISGVTKTADQAYTGTISTSGSGTQGQNIKGAITITGNGPASTAPTDKDGDGLLDDEEKPVCEASSSPLSWGLCAVFNGMADFTDWMLLNLIVPFMRPTPVGLNPDDKATGAVYKIWSTMRVYANIILVILLLIAVISQAYGGGLVEAYTARKMLPRILVAAILINISIYLVAFAIDIANIVGSSIADIITTPLVQTGEFKFNPSNTQAFAISGIAVFLGAIVAFLVTSGTLLAALPFLLIFIILPAFLGLLTVFITLIILQGLYMALTIFSPIAFALYALPNTEKYFHTWWEWLFRSLLVYPIFMTILGLCDVFSVLIQKANG